MKESEFATLRLKTKDAWKLSELIKKLCNGDCKKMSAEESILLVDHADQLSTIEPDLIF